MLLFGTVCSPGWLRHRTSLLIIGLMVCSLMIAISTFFPVRRIRRSIFGLMVCCFLLYCQAGEVASRSVVRMGMPFPRVSAVEGTLTADSSVSGKGNQVFHLLLDRCQGKDGSMASCGGELLVVGKNFPTYLAGTRLSFGGAFSPGDEGSNDLFLADSVKEVSVGGVKGICGLTYRRFRLACISWISSRLRVGGDISADESDADDADSSHHARLLALMLLLGRCDDPFFPLKELSQACGCAHVLALSGMHLQFFAGTVAWFCSRLLGRRRGRLVAILPVLLFIFIAGPRPSLIRSVLMFLCAVLPTAIGREGLPVSKAYALAFIIQIFLFPHTVATAGCLFSYAALGGLLALSGFVGAILSRFLPRRMARAWSAAFVAALWSAPCSLRMFGYWSPVGLLLSPVVGALIALSMAFGVMMLCVGPGPGILSVGVDYFATWLYRLLEGLMRWGSGVGEAFGQSKGMLGFLLYGMVLLTGSIAILYAGTVLRRRSIRRHELELCIRFPDSDYGIVG